MMNALESASTRPYLIRALYEWCTDNAFTPYIAVLADDTVQVPREYVQNGEIVLNISFDATSALRLGNEYVEFKARFGGVPCDIMVPIDRILAIYARENGQGMAFPVALPAAAQMAADEQMAAEEPSPAEGAPEPAARAGIQLVPASDMAADAKEGSPPRPEPPSAPRRPALKRIK